MAASLGIELQTWCIQQAQTQNTCLAGQGTPTRLPVGQFEGNEQFEFSAEQVALIAVARLRLPTTAPGIGPDPSINQWKMAAVGYPLWLWAEGPSHVGPVSETVGPLSVSLDAQLTGVTYAMGDGHVVSCAGAGRKWSRSVRAGATSSCGYVYKRPSLPRGAYTVTATAHWAVSWQIGAETGVLPINLTDSRPLPVGELQVLVR